MFERRLNRIGMGYTRRSDPSAHAPVSWVGEEHWFSHPWSIMKRCKDYGYHKLDKVMTIETYLNLPVDILDDVIEGIRVGSELRSKEDPKAPSPELTGLEKLIEDSLKGKT